MDQPVHHMSHRTQLKGNIRTANHWFLKKWRTRSSKLPWICKEKWPITTKYNNTNHLIAALCENYLIYPSYFAVACVECRNHERKLAFLVTNTKSANSRLWETEIRVSERVFDAKCLADPLAASVVRPEPAGKFKISNRTKNYGNRTGERKNVFYGCQVEILKIPDNIKQCLIKKLWENHRIRTHFTCRKFTQDFFKSRLFLQNVSWNFFKLLQNNHSFYIFTSITQNSWKIFWECSYYLLK